MTGRAWVSVSGEFLIERLGLPKGTTIMRADMNDYNFNLRLGLQGAALPEAAEGAAVPAVTLLARLEEIDGVRRVYGSLSHAPENEWLIDERPLPAPAPEALEDAE